MKQSYILGGKVGWIFGEYGLKIGRAATAERSVDMWRRILCWLGLHGWKYVIKSNDVYDVAEGRGRFGYIDVIKICRYCGKER